MSYTFPSIWKQLCAGGVLFQRTAFSAITAKVPHEKLPLHRRLGGEHFSGCSASATAHQLPSAAILFTQPTTLHEVIGEGLAPELPLDSSPPVDT